MNSSNSREEVLAEVRELSLQGQALRQRAMEALSRLTGWNWCGVYRLEGDVLVLDAFVGEPTEHRRIPIGVGVCGSAVAEGRNQVVPDVLVRSNYLACSTRTRSEIVVLIRRGPEILGQIDIDSHRPSAFDSDDEAFLEGLADLLASRWEEQAAPGPGLGTNAPRSVRTTDGSPND